MSSDRMCEDDERLSVSVIQAGDRVMVPVAGEVDLLTSGRLGAELETAVSSGAWCVEVDFRRVDWCDCSGLGVLLGVREQALKAGVCLCLSGPLRPPVARVLQLTELEPVLLRKAA